MVGKSKVIVSTSIFKIVEPKGISPFVVDGDCDEVKGLPIIPQTYIEG